MSASENNSPEKPNASKIQSTQSFSREEVNQILAKRSTQTIKAAPPSDETKGLFRIQMVEGRHSFTIPLKSVILLGRPDPITGEAPDIDFTALAGYRMGVSRSHARLILKDNLLNLHDLGSSNGTFLNSVRLKINQPQVVYNGDEVLLGRLAMYVYYEIQGEETIIPLRGLD